MTSREQYEKERDRAVAINLSGTAIGAAGTGYAGYQGFGHKLGNDLKGKKRSLKKTKSGRKALAGLGIAAAGIGTAGYGSYKLHNARKKYRNQEMVVR